MQQRGANAAEGLPVQQRGANAAEGCPCSAGEFQAMHLRVVGLAKLFKLPTDTF